MMLGRFVARMCSNDYYLGDRSTRLEERDLSSC